MSIAEQKRCAGEGMGFFSYHACVYALVCVRTQREALLVAIGCSLASIQVCT